jgi:hypothetical protein
MLEKRRFVVLSGRRNTAEKRAMQKQLVLTALISKMIHRQII